MKPKIDFGKRTVHIGQCKLCVVTLGKASVQNTAKRSLQPSTNSFAELSISDVDIVGSSGVGATPVDDVVVPKKSRNSVQCVQCGKKLSGSCGTTCKRCKNNSFAGLINQQEGEVSVAKHCVQQQVTKKLLPTTTPVECVSLQQFTRAGKRGYYEYVGLLQAKDILSSCDRFSESGVALHDNVEDVVQPQLNFTHRTAHGGDGDIEGVQGKYAHLAREQLENIKQKYPEVFCEPVYPVDRSSCPVNIKHEIRLQDESAPPPKRRIYPLDNEELEELKTQLQQFIESNRIRPSNSPYGAPILFAKKKGGALRMCIDYRLLNQQSVVDSFPLPRIDELLQRLDGSSVFSKLDLRDGYHQIPMLESDVPKTAFSCRYGTFEFLVMPFGLSSAPGTFQRMMNQVLFDLLDEGVVCYLDDLLIYTKTVDQHKKVLDKVFALLQKNKLFLKDIKCHLFLEQVNFLGHVVSANGVSVEQGKVDAIKKWPQPESVNQVQQFLGLANYYRRFVLRFSELASPLSQLTRKGHVFKWGLEQQTAFDTLKKALCSTPVLKLFDKGLKTRVVADASNFCVGAVLEQCDSTGSWHPVEYFSKRLTQSERNYSATDREFVAIRLALERWRHFLIGQKFLILTDHAALTYLQTSQGANRRNARWLEFLSQFTFDIEHIKGKENVIADGLSRIPGSELLTNLELCSDACTLGVQHVDDLPLKLCSQSASTSLDCNNLQFLNGVISINERETFRQQLLDEQSACKNEWFKRLQALGASTNPSYQFRNGLLCKLVGDHFCPIIPDRTSSTVQVILHDLHTSPLGGHLGRRKLLDSVQKRFFWQNMFQSVDQFCKNCPVCQQHKGSTSKPRGLLQPLENPTKCFDHVSMDFVMHLPTSTRGHDAIFSIVDRFSRMVRFVPCSSTLTAVDAANLFFEHWVCRFGMPSKIISDRDPRFQSSFWQSLTQLLGARVALSSSYHPQTDGLTERFHRSVEQVLRCYCSAQQSHWCTLLSQCEFALNSTIQDSHSEVPFVVVYGQQPQLPIDLLAPVNSVSAEEAAAARVQVSHQVRRCQKEAAARMKCQADKRRAEVDFTVGQRVWLSTTNLPVAEGTRKLAARWTGPYEVLARVTDNAWRLKLPGSFRLHPVFHSSQLKPVIGQVRRSEPVQLQNPADVEYEVERITSKRTVRGRLQYRVRWKGYSEFDDTWEPLTNLKNCPEMIREFEASQKT